MKIQGTIKKIGDVQTFESGFTKRVLLVETDEQYPQDLPVEFLKDKTSILDKFKEGQKVDVAINIRGSEYNGKHYVNLTGWAIKDLSNTLENPDSSEIKDEPLPF